MKKIVYVFLGAIFVLLILAWIKWGLWEELVIIFVFVLLLFIADFIYMQAKSKKISKFFLKIYRFLGRLGGNKFY